MISKARSTERNRLDSVELLSSPWTTYAPPGEAQPLSMGILCAPGPREVRRPFARPAPAWADHAKKSSRLPCWPSPLLERGQGAERRHGGRRRRAAAGCGGPRRLRLGSVGGGACCGCCLRGRGAVRVELGGVLAPAPLRRRHPVGAAVSAAARRPRGGGGAGLGEGGA